VEVEAEFGEPIADAADVGVEFGNPVWFALDDFDRFFAAIRHGGGEGVGEEAGAGALLEHFGDVRGGGNIAAGCAAECFAERAGDDVDLAMQSKVLGSAAAPLPEHTHAVGIIDDEHRVVGSAQSHQFRQLRHIAFHTEDAVSDDPAAGFGSVGLQFGFEIRKVAVLICSPAGCRR
jgi:hypothetical protein